MLKVSVVLVVLVIVVHCRDTLQLCNGKTRNCKTCAPTYQCIVPHEKFVTARLCGYDGQQPLVCCHLAKYIPEDHVETIFLNSYTIDVTCLHKNNSAMKAIITLPTKVRQPNDLKTLANRFALIKFKVTNISRYKRAPELELYTSNPLPERESNVIPNPVALSANTTDPPLELFTSPPLAVEASVIPAVVPLQSQSDKPDTSSIMNLFTSPPLPLPPRSDSNGVTTEKPTTPVEVHSKPPTGSPPIPKPTKKPEHPVDSRPIVFEDSLPTTTPKSDQIYFPDKVPGLAENELESKLNALSAVIPPTSSKATLDRILPNRHTCGYQKDNKGFVDSTIADLDDFPWIALLRYSDSFNRDAGFRCSGTLISDRHVLTAAHCLEIDLFCVDSVRLGEWKVSSKHDCFVRRGRTLCADPVMDIAVAKKIAHKDYDPNSRNNDIALLRLKMRVPFTDFVRPICLPIRNLREPQLGTIFATSGWGTSPFGFQLDIKSKITFPVIHGDYCKEYSRFKEQTCIGYSRRHDFGKMDPGGPVMALESLDKPQWYLEGVITRGYGCNLLSYPGAYTRLTFYIDWLLEAVVSDATR